MSYSEEVQESARDVIACKTRSHVAAARLLALYVVNRSSKLEEIADAVRAILDNVNSAEAAMRLTSIDVNADLGEPVRQAFAKLKLTLAALDD